jgi:hypothetical protein
MRRLAVALVLAALVAGCGGSKQSAPTTVTVTTTRVVTTTVTTTTGATTGATTTEEPATALLTAVKVTGNAVRFDFESTPREVRASYQPRSALRGCGSGLPVAVKGTAFVIVHFQPAATADIQGAQVTPTYTGPSRIEGPGPVLETVKTCDFEADLAWAIGVESQLGLRVSQSGSTVTVSFG